MKKNQPLELLLKKFKKELQHVDLKDIELVDFEGVFEVNDENGHTRKIFMSPKSTLGDVQKND